MAPALQLKQLRLTLGLTQAEMAKEMGLAVRSYQQLEAGEKEIRRRHVALAERVSLGVAVARRDPYLAMPSIREEAMQIAALLPQSEFRPQTDAINRQVIAAINDELASYQSMLSQKTSGREFANRIESVLISIRNAISNLDQRLSEYERDVVHTLAE
jgi:transcriptional regulator with XRE-family HTH domain